LIETNKEKRKLMDQYLRNVKVIEDAFDQIKQATGISNIEEIVTTFIKAEEQNYSLQNYVNMLNTEFDQLEESNKDIREQIAKIVERGQMSNQEKLNLEKSLIDECAMLDDDIRTNLNEADTTKKQLRNIQKHVGIMVHMFKRSKFFLCVA
jgi:chromosome segregation ATPase